MLKYVCMLALIFSGFAAHAADLQGPPAKVQVPARVKVQTVERFAAVAVSTDSRKDAFGFQYDKDSAHAAELDAVAFCEERFSLKGIRGGRCAVKSSTDYVVGMYCRNAQRQAGIGTGLTPVEAANNALLELADANLRHCDFKKMRHGTIAKSHIDDAKWTAMIRCGRGEAAMRIHGAINALNAALKQCGDVRASSVQVMHLQLQ